MQNKLYVGGLSWNTDSAGLEEAFASYGQVVEAKVITDRDTGKSRGFGFVTYGSQAEAEKALEMNGRELDGRTLKVDLARERQDRGGPPRREW